VLNEIPTSCVLHYVCSSVVDNITTFKVGLVSRQIGWHASKVSRYVRVVDMLVFR